MSNRTKSRVTYDSIESYSENGRKVDEYVITLYCSMRSYCVY